MTGEWAAETGGAAIDGFTRFGPSGGAIYLSPRTCSTLLSIREETAGRVREPVAWRIASAIRILAAQSAYVRYGFVSAASIACEAARTFRSFAERLLVPPRWLLRVEAVGRRVVPPSAVPGCWP